jgi:hypothetical protein
MFSSTILADIPPLKVACIKYLGAVYLCISQQAEINDR